MNQQTNAGQTNLHPIFAGILNQAAEAPVQVRRAEYASRLARMDWSFEYSDCGNTYCRGRAELYALMQLQIELDPTASIWNRNATEQYKARRVVRVECTLPNSF